VFGVLVSLGLWIPAPKRRARGPWLAVLFSALAILWVFVMVLSMTHGDAYTHGVWTYPVILAMLWWKFPSREEGIGAIVLSAWLLATILVFTRLLELLRVIPMATVSEGMTRYEQQHYWLPLSGWLGPDGRWPGPMGHNANTGNMGAYLIVVGVALRRKYALVFVAVGVVTLLLTGSKGSMVAASVGVVVAVLLGDYAWTRRFSRTWLLVGTLIAGTLVFGLAFLSSPNLTGRTTGYWPDFLDLWRTSPVTGVGLTGIAQGPELIRDSNGHNLIIDVLAKYGLLTVVPLAASLAAGLGLTIRAALRFEVVPLSIMSTFLVIGITEADFSWAAPSTPWLFFMLATITAAGVQRPRTKDMQDAAVDAVQ
jgi:hypothetical protein